MLAFLTKLYFTRRFFALGIALTLLFVVGYLLPWAYSLARIGVYVLLALLLTEILLLWGKSKGLQAQRQVAERLSNGDDNPVQLSVSSSYGYPVRITLHEEAPLAFQQHGLTFSFTLKPRQTHQSTYNLKPVRRGVYQFGVVNVFAQVLTGLVQRRYRLAQAQSVKVYPSYLQLRKYEFLAISNQLQDLGIKKIRRIGHTQEFEHIREYVVGDDFRTLNWKASARRGSLQVNQYIDERSQQVFSVIDKGRLMRFPFEGMSLLDYAINASLVMSNIAIKKQDKAGLITFQHKVGTLIQASKRSGQMKTIQEGLYGQKTAFKDSDFRRLAAVINTRINQRSLLLLFTNFETIDSMQRQLPYLRMLAKKHLLVTIFFKNTTLEDFAREPVQKLRGVYQKTIAERFLYEKRLIVKILRQHGIQTVLSSPQELTVDTINKYLELKARGFI